MCIIGLGDKFKERELVCGLVFGERELGNEVGEDGGPVLARHIAIGSPVLEILTFTPVGHSRHPRRVNTKHRRRRNSDRCFPARSWWQIIRQVAATVTSTHMLSVVSVKRDCGNLPLPRPRLG